MHPENLKASRYQPGPGTVSPWRAGLRRMLPAGIYGILAGAATAGAVTIAALAAWPAGPVLMAVAVSGCVYVHKHRKG